MLSYANYNTDQYNSLNRNVNFVVDLWSEWNIVQKELSQANTERNALRLKENTSASTAIDEIAQHLASYDCGPEERKRKANAIISEIRDLKLDYPSPQSKEKQKALAQRFCMLYCKLDREAIQADLAETLEAQKTVTEEIRKLDGRIGGLTKRLNNIMAQYEGAFTDGDVPTTYQGMVCPSDKVGKRNWGWQIICDFIRDWAARARYYQCPVTIYGTSINSISDRVTREIWLTAYNKLKLGEQPKAMGMFQARIAPKGEVIGN